MTQAADGVTFTHPLARVAPRRDPLLTVSVVSTANLDMLSVAGEIDLDTLPVLHRELWKVRGQDRNHLLVDLTSVTFMDAGALGLLVAVQQWVNASHGSLSLCLNARGVRLVGLTRLTGFFTIQAERECARATP